MDKKEVNIPTFDPQTMEINLFQSWGKVFQPHIHDFSMVFHINRIEDFIQKIKVPSEQDLHPYRLTVFHFLFLISGTCIRSKGLTQYEFGRDTFFIMPPFEITSVEHMSDDARGFFCYFKPELLSRDFKMKDLLADYSFLNFNSNPIVTVSHDSRNQILNLITRLEKEYMKGKECRQEILRTYLLALFAELTPFVKPNTYHLEDKDCEIAVNFRKALVQNVYELQKTGDYARMLKISVTQLNKSVKNITGKRAGELIQDMVLLESKVLLKQTSLSISEITYKLGQKHISNFVRLFKFKTGMSPGEYRNTVKTGNQVSI